LAALEEQIAQRRALQQRLMMVEEHERRRISRELHDGTGQLLVAIALELDLLRRSIPEDSPDHERLERLRPMMKDFGNELHRIVVELRPPALDDIGLPTMLRNYLDEWSVRTGIQVDFVSIGFESRPSSSAETTIYRIVQEALTNVTKHAGARCVSVIAEFRDGRLGLTVEDDGCGFDVDAVLAAGGTVRHLGLLGIKERLDLLDGTFTIESRPGGPTALLIRVPATRGST
jgi:signal transduction histidine kinase